MRGKHTAQYELDSELISHFTAAAIVKEFDLMVGGPLLTSSVVYLAALRVCRIIYGPFEDPIRALDEHQALEQILVAHGAREGGGAEANSS